MARVDKRSILQGVHGQIGDQVVLRELNRQNILAMKPSYKDKPTPAMLSGRARFRLAVKLAKADIADPVIRARYEAECRTGQSVFNVAISEHMARFNPGGKKALEKMNLQNVKKRRKPVNGIRIKDITLLIDTANESFTESDVIAPDEHIIEWLCAAAKRKTSEKLTNIIVRIRCA